MTTCGFCDRYLRYYASINVKGVRICEECIKLWNGVFARRASIAEVRFVAK